MGNWVNDFFLIGARLRVWESENPGKLITLVISVPTNSFASLLISAGWASTTMGVDSVKFETGIPPLGRRISVALSRRFLTGTVNQVTPSSAVIGGNNLIITGKRRWVLDESSRYVSGETSIPNTASFIRHWDERVGDDQKIEEWLWGMYPDAVIIGSRTRLSAEGKAKIGISPTLPKSLVSLHSLSATKEALLPSHRTEIYPAANFDLNFEQDTSKKLAIFDGNAATQFLPIPEVPIKVVLIDRSIGSKIASDMVLSERNQHLPIASREVVPFEISPSIGLLSIERQW